MDHILLCTNHIPPITTIYNSFIEDYMPAANGSYVKVYLYIAKCLQAKESNFSISSLADQLENTEKDILRALMYWEKKGLMSLNRDKATGEILGLEMLIPFAERDFDTYENTAKESFLSKYTIECIYNGVDTSVFFPRDRAKAREKFGLTEKFTILGVSSVWNEKKGLKRFLGLSAAADKDETVVMVGLTREQVAAMPENVIGLEKTESREALAELYSAADVFFNASVEETFGLVTAEALACGTPAVVFDSTACAEVIKDNFSRVISPDADVKAAVEYIKNNEKPVYGTSLLDPAFIKEKMVEDYFALYEVLKNDGKEQRV